MTRRTVFAATLALAVAVAALPAHAAAVVGQAAPDFTLVDSQGQKHTLSSLKGKTVVLEWINYDCPFVQKHYNSGHMQKLQKDFAAKGVVWLAINSSNKGKQGNFPPAEIEARSKKHGAAFAAYLIDEDGTVGRAYGAKTTPHMYIIDPKGTLLYAGGIDDKPSTDLADIHTARNFVQVALDEALAGKPVTTTTSQPYGCSVKY
jgi:peroxiredoxin